MTRTSIQQFRASLLDGADQTAAMRAYRQIALRPAPADGRVGVEWAAWPAVEATAGDWIPWGAAPAAAGWMEWQGGPAAAPRLAGWGDWSTPPAPASA
ncbi:MAG: hypothetical protein ACJ8J0_16065 [Longimicrobiaceae bacterium]